MAESRKHKTLSAAELKARGASVYSRAQGTEGYAKRSAAQQVEDVLVNEVVQPRGNGASQQVKQGVSGPSEHRVSVHEASDPNRYLRMNQERQRKLPFGRSNAQKSSSSVGSKKVALPSMPDAGSVLAGARSFNWASTLTWTKRILLGLLLAYAVFVCFVSVKMNLGVDLVTRSKLSFAIPGKPYYTLLVGTDKSEERVEAGMTTYRTDSIILARIDPIAGKITLVSIQRDTKVDLEGYGTQKINAAYALGGAPLLIEAVSNLAGVPISNYAEIDFDSFVSVVDALGGIDVNVPIDINDDLAEVHLSAGQQTINGTEALGLCRARHAYDSYGAGDYYRTANQRMVLGAILKKGLNGNPFNLVALIGSVSNSVNCTFLPLNITFLGLRFVGFDMSNNLMSGLEPTVSSYEDGVWWEVVDTDAWSTMMSRVDQGLSPYADSSEDPTAGVAGIT